MLRNHSRKQTPVALGVVVVVVVVVVVIIVVELIVHGAVKATVTNAPQSQLNK